MIFPVQLLKNRSSDFLFAGEDGFELSKAVQFSESDPRQNGPLIVAVHDLKTVFKMSLR